MVENLLENSRVKRQVEPGLAIQVELRAIGNEVRLRVSDDGSPIENEVAEKLFKGPVKSRNGLGIGLFQAAKQAEQMGYKLSLNAQQDAAVCFELRRTNGSEHPGSPKGLS